MMAFLHRWEVRWSLSEGYPITSAKNPYSYESIQLPFPQFIIMLMTISAKHHLSSPPPHPALPQLQKNMTCPSLELSKTLNQYCYH